MVTTLDDNPCTPGTEEYYAWERIAGPPRDPAPDEPMTEYGYARRLIAAHGGQIRFVYDWKRWLSWDGRRWALDTGQAAQLAKRLARTMVQVALETDDDKARRTKVFTAMKFERANVIAAVLTLASTEPEIVVRPDQLDADPFLLNVANGTVDLRTGKLRDHAPDDLLTKVCRAAYDPQAAGPRWDAFLWRVQPDGDMRAFLARLLGHAIEGRISEHILPVFYGSGANGKSTFADAIRYALGDYAAIAEPDLITARSWDAHPTGTADLAGLRLAIVSESDQGRKLAEGTVKRLTSSEPLKARRMREDFWEFTPTHMLLLLTNHKPIVGGTDEGIWRRLRLVPWDVVVPPHERDHDLGDALALEADAILSWLVRGYGEWRRDGLGEPQAVKAATAAYRAESDAIGRFIADRCLTGPHFHVGSSNLFDAYTRWTADEGLDAVTQTALGTELVNRGFDKHRGTGGRWVWDGIGLSAGDSDG